MGITDDLTGQTVNAFVSLKDGHENTIKMRQEFTMQVRKSIGPFAAPKVCRFFSFFFFFFFLLFFSFLFFSFFTL